MLGSRELNDAHPNFQTCIWRKKGQRTRFRFVTLSNLCASMFALLNEIPIKNAEVLFIYCKMKICGTNTCAMFCVAHVCVHVFSWIQLFAYNLCTSLHRRTMGHSWMQPSGVSIPLRPAGGLDSQRDEKQLCNSLEWYWWSLLKAELLQWVKTWPTLWLMSYPSC